jgi:hypothetical protein
VKVSRVILIVVVIVVIAIVVLFAYVALAGATSSNKTAVWNSAAEYSLQVSGSYGVIGQQCVNDSSYIYCVGGQDYNSNPRNAVFSTNPLSSSSTNVSSWTTDNNAYPQPIYDQSCVTFGNNVYCIGGTNDDAGDDTNASYYASLNGGTVGGWTATTVYPIPVDTQSCVTNSGYVYCVGGENETDGLAGNAQNSSSVWFAPLSSSGIGNWSLTTPYPAGIYFPLCYASEGYIYCLGGADINNNAVASIYYASLSSSGVGTWMQATAYPEAVSAQSCVIVSSVIYCVGGEGTSGAYTDSVYYASVSSTGIGAWKSGETYPDTVATDCSVVSGYVYCMGGQDDSSSGITAAVYFASLSGITGTTTTG